MTSVLNNERQINNIIYQAKVKASISNYNQKIFYETSKGTFKLRYGNHKIFFHFEQRQKDTELSNGYRSLKNLMLVGKLSLAFWDNAHLLDEKQLATCVYMKNFSMIEYTGASLLNQRNLLVSKCRHKNKFKLTNQKLLYA